MAANNSSTTTIDTSHIEPLEIVIPLMLSCVIAVVSNVFVLYLILNVPRLKTVTNVFVFSICVCNIMFAVILLPAHCFFQNTPPYNYLVIIIILVYICNLTAVSYDRLISITKPMLYALKITKQKAIRIVIFMWVLPMIYCLLPLIWHVRQDPSSMNVHRMLATKIYKLVTLVVFLLGPLFFIVFVYIKVCLEMKKMRDFKKRTLTPTSTVAKNGECYKRNSTSQFRELKKLPSAILNTMRTDAEWNAMQRMRTLKQLPSKLFYNVRTRRTVSVNTTTSHLPESRKVSHLPDVILSEKVTQAEILESTELTGLARNGVDVDVQTVTFISMTKTQSSSDVCAELVRASLGKSDGNCRNSNHSIVDDDSDADNSYPSSDVDNLSGSSTLPQGNTFSPSTTRKRQSSISKMKRKAYELKASLAFLIVAITYMFTWLPVVALTFGQVLKEFGHDVELPVSLAYMSLYAIALNALSDPFLYGLLLPNFRRTLKILLRRLRKSY